MALVCAQIVDKNKVVNVMHSVRDALCLRDPLDGVSP